MKNYEEQKIKYFNKLSEHEQLMEILAENKENKDLVKILLFPKNEKELEFANHYIMIFEDISQMMKNGEIENIKEIDLNNSIFMEFMISTLYSKNNEEKMLQFSKKQLETNLNITAQLLYEMYAITLSNKEGMIHFLSDKYGFDVNNNVQVMQFQFLLKNAQEDLQTVLNYNPKEANDIDKFVTFAKHFHGFCINGIIDNCKGLVK